MNRLIEITFLISSFLIISCSSNPNSNSDKVAIEETLPDDFQDFLDTFHTDLAFQKAHVLWPLQGLPTMMDSSYVEGSFRWTEEDWVMHKEFDIQNDEFEQTYTMYGPDMVVEQILHINGSMGMERRFSRRDDTWNLIYYAGMNLIGRQ